MRPLNRDVRLYHGPDRSRVSADAGSRGAVSLPLLGAELSDLLVLVPCDAGHLSFRAILANGGTGLNSTSGRVILPGPDLDRAVGSGILDAEIRAFFYLKFSAVILLPARWGIPARHVWAGYMLIGRQFCCAAPEVLCHKTVFLTMHPLAFEFLFGVTVG